jgi:branched-subunit amino acid permease
LTQALKGRKLVLVGFTLFSMFFGAGNLIFPPDLGAKAGVNLWPAFLGLAISAVGLPVAGVIAVARADGLDKLAGRVHPVFAQVFMILIYLSIGPCLAIPRTASTSFAMLTPLLGRLLCPCLLVLILILFGGCLLHPLAAQYAAPTETYRSAVVLQGVLYGYQTMDALAALNFGAVIAMNIRAQGVVREQDVQRSAIRAGFIAGGLLLAVYAMLGHAGALTGAAAPGLATGAEVLTVLAERMFGKAGLVLLAAIFMLACFNTCVGLIACVGEYFHTLLPRIPYPALAAFFAAASMLIANLGLADILRLSVPVLNALYPVAIVLITLSFVPGLEQRRRVYPLCIGCTAVQSIAAALPLGPLSALANALPLAALGFGWVLPAVIGLLAGIFLSCTEE